jgi:hypothetical protein
VCAPTTSNPQRVEDVLLQEDSSGPAQRVEDVRGQGLGTVGNGASGGWVQGLALRCRVWGLGFGVWGRS